MMSRWGSRAVALVGVAALTALTAACGGDGNDNGSGPTQVTVWIQNGATATMTKEYLEDTWAPKNNVDVKVTVQASDQYQQAMTVALKTGKGPDVFQSGVPGLLEAGYLLPLDDLLTEQTKSQYAGVLNKENGFVYKGKTYGVATSANTRRLAYNKDIFKAAGLDPAKPPATFGEIESDCAAIVAKVKGVSCFGVPLKWAGFVNWDLASLIAAGDAAFPNQNLFDNDAGAFDFEAAAPAVQLYRDLVQRKWAYPGASSLDNDPMRTAFAQGKIAMFVSASWDIGLLNDSFKTKADWAAARLPVPDGQQYGHSTYSPGTGFQINAATKVKDAAARVLQAITGTELSTQLASAGLLISVNKEVTIEDAELAPQFADYAPQETDVPNVTTPAGLVKITGDSYAQAITKLILGSDDIGPGLKDIQDKYNKALQDAVKSGDVDLNDYR